MVEIMKKVSVEYVKNAEIARGLRPGAVVIDVTLDGATRELDPSFPVGGLSVPGMEGEKGLSWKGIWEGLKVFDKKNEIDGKWWKDERKVGKERNCKSYGRIKGLRISDEIISMDKGYEFFMELYRNFVRERYRKVIEGLSKEKRDVVLLDYAEGDGRRWLNHAEILMEMKLEKENKE